MKKKLILAVAGATVLATIGGCDFLGFGCKKSVKGPEAICAANAPLSPTEASEQDANDPVLIKIDGKAAVRKTEFLEFAEQAMKANPYLANFGITSYQTAPPPIKEQLFEAMVQQKLITAWGTDKGICNEAEFQKMRAKTIKQLEQALMAQTFETRILENVTVNNDEVIAEYEKSRDRFVKQAGQVNLIGASFDDEEKANVFYHLVADTQEGSFNGLAQESGVEVKEFGAISKDPRMAMESTVPFAVRKAAFELADDQYFAQAKDGDTYWVLQAIDRTAPTYLGLEEVREQVEGMVRNEKFRIARDERLSELRGAYTVDIDKSSLGPDGPDPLAALQAALAQQGDERPVTASA